MKPTSTFIPIVAIAATILLVASNVQAADLTVAQGDSLTVSTNATYDAVVVNGNLSLAPNVTVTCATLVVADNIAGTATLTLGNGARFEVTGADNYGNTKIAIGSGRAEITLGEGAWFSTTGFLNFCYGYDSAPDSSATMSEALLIVGPNATVRSGKAFHFGHEWNSRYNAPGGSQGAAVKAVVRLDAGAELSTSQIINNLPASGTILFNGGRVAGRSGEGPHAYDGGKGFIHFGGRGDVSRWTNINLEGTNGCPITFHIPSSANYTSFLTIAHVSSYMYLRGDGGFLKTGAAVFPFVDSANQWASDSNLRMLFTGDMVLEEGGFSVATTPADNVFRAAANNISRPVDVVVGNAGVFDLAGCNVVLNSITAPGGGFVTNSVAGTVTMTLGVRDGLRPMTLARAVPGIALSKQGASAVTLCGDAVDSLNLQAGSLSFKSREIMGYPFYRILFDERKGGRTGMIALREFAWMNDGEDATRPYAKVHYDISGTSTASSPETLFDNDFSDTAYYYDLRMGDPAAWKHDLIGATVEYETCHPVDGYRWAPMTFWKADNSEDRDPSAWRVFGGFSSTTNTSELTLLDQVTGFRVTTITTGNWNATNFVCSYAPTTTTIGALTLASGVPLAVDGAEVTVSSASAASGVPVSLSHGAVLTLPQATEVASLAVDVDAGGGTLANFRPASGGALYLTGAVARPRRCVTPVRVGTLLGSALPSWDVYVDGVLVDQTEVIVNADGFLQTQYTGSTVLYIK